MNRDISATVRSSVSSSGRFDELFFRLDHYAIPPFLFRFFLVRFLALIILSAFTASSVKLLLRYHVHTATTAVSTDDTPSNISSSETSNGFQPAVTNA